MMIKKQDRKEEKERKKLEKNMKKMESNIDKHQKSQNNLSKKIDGINDTVNALIGQLAVLKESFNSEDYENYKIDENKHSERSFI